MRNGYGTAQPSAKRSRLKWTVLFAVLLLASCSTKKKLVTDQPSVDFEWMTAKISGELSLTANRYLPSVGEGSRRSSLTFTGTVRMRRDSTVWLSASAFMGMENVRVLITQDTVTLLNRVDQTYLIESYGEMADRYHWPATLRETQDLVLGKQPKLRIGPYEASIEYSDIRWNEPTTFPIKINKNYERVKP